MSYRGPRVASKTQGKQGKQKKKDAKPAIEQCFRTVKGGHIYNPAAYAKTGAPMLNRRGKNINAETSIYEMQCRSKKNYVGKTTNMDRRMKQHFTGNGSKVTKKFAPVRGREIAKCPGFYADAVEQHLTEKAVAKHGYGNVRGGRWVNSTTLKEERCGRCGRDGHAAAKCYARTTTRGREISRDRI